MVKTLSSQFTFSEKRKKIAKYMFPQDLLQGALASMAQSAGRLSVPPKVAGSISSQGTCLGYRLNPL